MMWGWDAGWWGLGMMLVWLVFLAAIVIGVVLLMRSTGLGDRQDQRPDRNAALGILDERFASGEIDQAEYEARRAALTGGK